MPFALINAAEQCNPAELPPLGTTQQLTPAADLTVELQLEEGTYRFLVSRAALRVASPVWRISLDPDTKYKPLDTDGASGETILRLSDIDYHALLTLFNIVHYRWDLLPKSLTFHGIRALAQLADEYNCGDVLNPWVGNWISLLRKEVFDSYLGPTVDCFLDWTFIARVFDDSDDAKKLAEQLTKKATRRLIKLDPDNQTLHLSHFNISPLSLDDGSRTLYCRHQAQSSLDCTLITDSCLRSMSKTRQDAIAAVTPLLIRLVHDIIDLSKDTKDRLTVRGKEKTSGLLDPGGPICRNSICLNVSTGSLVRSLYAVGLDELLSPERVPEYLQTLSIETISGRVRGLSIDALVISASSNPNLRHDTYVFPSPRDKVASISQSPDANIVRLRDEADLSSWRNRSWEICRVARRFLHTKGKIQAILKDPPIAL
ncbi:hypothetical protein ABW19_dt0206127 [Dactylella cylindrospora]|nr:hypothetical protein ABW19_dt0206127 [Dactylella cylindrospora]